MIFLSSLGGIKQKFQEFKSSFQALINDLRLDMERKFENTNRRLQELPGHRKTNIVDQMNDHTIIDVSKEDNAQLTNKFELLDKKLTEVQVPCNDLEQYTSAIILSSIQGEIILKFRVFLHRSLMKN